MKKHGMLSDSFLAEIVGGNRRSSHGCRPRNRPCQPECQPAPQPDCGDDDTSSGGCATALSGALQSFAQFCATFTGLKGGTGKQALQIVAMVLRAGR